MKKVLLVLAPLVALLIFAGCQRSKSVTFDSSSTEMKATTAESIQMVEDVRSVFSGVLAEDAAMNEDTQKTIRLMVTDVEPMEDPEELYAAMKNDGVILNVLENELANHLTAEDFKAGDKVKFTIVGRPIMTMSIPPQLAGNVQMTVEKVN